MSQQHSSVSLLSITDGYNKPPLYHIVYIDVWSQVSNSWQTEAEDGYSETPEHTDWFLWWKKNLTLWFSLTSKCGITNSPSHQCLVWSGSRYRGEDYQSTTTAAMWSPAEGFLFFFLNPLSSKNSQPSADCLTRLGDRNDLLKSQWCTERSCCYKRQINSCGALRVSTLTTERRHLRAGKTHLHTEGDVSTYIRCG